MRNINRLVTHETWASVIGMVYLGLIVNLLLLLTCLPFVVLLATTDPTRSWPLLAAAAAAAAPGATAAFRAFREHDASRLGPARAFVLGLRQTWRRALVIGAVVVAIVVVALVDVRLLSATPFAVAVVPLLGVVAVLAIAVGMLSLVALAEAPDARLRDIVKASAYLSMRRWYLTAVSLIGIVAQGAVFTTAPAIGLGVTASAVLYLVWANSRFTLRPVLALDEAGAVRA